MLALLAWWVVAAGPVTAFRIVYYNKTGIEDFKSFPSRSLAASAQPVTLERTAREIPDAARLDAVLRDNDTVAFLVVRNGKIAFERYYQGWTERSLSQSFSMGKSFLSMLVGAAIDDGYIASVHDPVTRYIPQLAARGFDEVTIEDLLQMRSGSNYVENENPFGIHARFTYTPTVEREILKLRVKDGSQPWGYKSGDTAILTLILDRVLSPRTVTDYMQETLWSPLGMEFGAAWTIDRPDGLEKTWCCLAAAARDYAKLGLLYLRDGRSGDEQIIPSAWVKRSVGVFTGDPVLEGHHQMMGVWSYNYHWWLVSQEDRSFMASGHGGQFLYVDPITDTVVVRLGKSRGDLKHAEWIRLFDSLAAGL